MNLNDPARIQQLRCTLEQKAALRLFYLEVYKKYQECIARSPAGGIALELGSGGGFAKTVIPEIMTSDILQYAGVDLAVDATRMPFEKNSLRTICMFNVLHHIPDAEAFFREAIRCLRVDGRLLIIDQHPGWISKPVLKYLHHEPYSETAPDWAFQSDGPLTGANGALPWIIFQRDRKKFETLFPLLRLERYAPHSPLRYWLAGGLKSWSLLPRWAFGLATSLDGLLVRNISSLGSLVDIELRKVAP